MVLAAGRGARARPLTDQGPKPLIEVGEKALIDHVLDRLAEVGVERAVVNLSYRVAMLERHLKTRCVPRIVISREAKALDTGGGVARALELLGQKPFVVVNADVLWRDRRASALERLAASFDGAAMDALLLLVPLARARGYEGRGDFFLEPDGRLRRRAGDAEAPLVFAGVQLLRPELFKGCPRGKFSLNLLYDRAAREGRLYGLVHAGDWFHVGTPAAVADARRLHAREGATHG